MATLPEALGSASSFSAAGENRTDVQEEGGELQATPWLYHPQPQSQGKRVLPPWLENTRFFPAANKQTKHMNLHPGWGCKWGGVVLPSGTLPKTRPGGTWGLREVGSTLWMGTFCGSMLGCE